MQFDGYLIFFMNELYLIMGCNNELYLIMGCNNELYLIMGCNNNNRTVSFSINICEFSLYTR